MNRRIVTSASIVVALALTSCGNDAPAVSANAVSDQLAGVCGTIGRGVANLVPVESLDDVRSNASDAAALFENGVNDLKQLKLPADDQEFTGAVRELIAGFDDQLDALDGIAKAARASDQETVDSKISKLSGQAADSNDLADSLEVIPCRLDPVFVAAPTPVETVPAETVPAETIPAETSPADTAPAGTTPPSNKNVVSADTLVPLGDYTFADAPQDAIDGFHALLDLSPTIATQSGRISGIDVRDLSGQPMGRIFAFESDTDPLTPGSLEEVTPFLTSDATTSPLTIGTEDGVTWADPDGTAYFLLGAGNVLLWALAPSADLLEPALHAWGESVSQ
ncbi:MAG: hypothetical protein ABI949_03845 [Ilumatobacteraceae bacterium]